MEYNNFVGRGDKVRFLNRNGYDHDLKRAREVLHTDQILTVKHVDIGNWSSTYTFEELPGGWNTVMFDPIYNNGKDPGLKEPVLDFKDTWAASDTVVFEQWFDDEYSPDKFGTLPNVMRLTIKEVALKAYVQGWKKAKNVHKT